MTGKFTSLVITEGSKDVGFGRLTRCIAFYQALERQDSLAQLIVHGDDLVRDLLKGKTYRILNWLKRPDELLGLVREVNVVILYSYLAELNFYKKISEMVERPVYLDDIQRVNYHRGLVVNGTIGVEKLRYAAKGRVTYLLGVQYASLRRNSKHLEQT